MKLLFLGGDRRMLFAAEDIRESGFETYTYGLKDQSCGDSLFRAVKAADAVILPLPVSSNGTTLNAPFTEKTIYLDDIICCEPKYLLGGMISDEINKKLSQKKIPFFDYFSDEKLTAENAVLTAEAAIAIAINGSDASVFRSNALVIGYGRIGNRLSSYLKTMGATVTATSRKDSVLAAIEADGLIPKSTDDVKSGLERYDFIFNTAPSPIMDKEFFSLCSKTCFVEDLATRAGTDIDSAKILGICADVYPGLPGKYFPRSAGKIISKAIIRHITE